ncbi:MAG: hypothetical protein LBI27_07825 [Clostridiales bacterium]|jgi:hypothetical protein|nr:hypothetical protein [Clostridiales bacterium]
METQMIGGIMMNELFVTAVISATISALLTYAISHMKKIITFISYHFSPRTRHLIVNVWYVYHRTYDDNIEKLRREKWNIEPSSSGFRVTAVDEDDSSHAYEGYLKVDEYSNLDGKMDGVRFRDPYRIMIKSPVPGRNIYAIVLGLDMDSNVVATIYLFSKDKISDEKVASLLDKKQDGSKTQLRLCAQQEQQPIVKVGSPSP